MARLFTILFSMIATTLMGIGVVGVLAVDQFTTWQPILYAAAGGFVLAIPVTWLVARKLVAMQRR